MLKKLLASFAIALMSLCPNAAAQTAHQNSNEWFVRANDYLTTLISNSDATITHIGEVALRERQAAEALVTVQTLGFLQRPGTKVTIRALMASTAAEATEYYAHMFEPFEMAGLYLRSVSFAGADRASETNIFGDGTHAVTWQKGTVVVEVIAKYGANSLALRVHRALEELDIYRDASTTTAQGVDSKDPLIGSDYPSAPLDVAKAFLSLLFEGDTDLIGKYINPSERAKAIEILLTSSDSDYRGHKIEQYEFGKIEIEGDRAGIIAKAPGMTAMEQIGMMVRVNGHWYVTFGLGSKPAISTKQVRDKNGKWVLSIPEDWVEGSAKSPEWSVYRPSNLDEYQVQFRMRKFSKDQASESPEKMREQLPTNDKFKVQFEDGPRIAKLAGYTKALYMHVTGIGIVTDIDVPESELRWHLIVYEVKTLHGTYACLAVCREDYYAEYQETLNQIFSGIAFQ